MKALLISLALFIGSSASAHYSTMDTGDLLDYDKASITAETQFVTSSGGGINLIARGDYGFSEDANLKALIGFGATDFQIGGYYKWVPIPDFENQPAIGLTAGILYARDEGYNELGVRFHPFISKKFKIETGDLTPFAAIPIGFAEVNDVNITPIQLQLGTKYRHPELEHVQFLTEIGFDMKDAFSYISFGAIFYLDDNYQFQMF